MKLATRYSVLMLWWRAFPAVPQYVFVALWLTRHRDACTCPSEVHSPWKKVKLNAVIPIGPCLDTVRLLQENEFALLLVFYARWELFLPLLRTAYLRRRKALECDAVWTCVHRQRCENIIFQSFLYSGLLCYDSSSPRPLPDSAHHSHETDSHDPGGIRTRVTSRRAAEGSGLRTRGHFDRWSSSSAPNMSSWPGQGEIYLLLLGSQQQMKRTH